MLWGRSPTRIALLGSASVVFIVSAVLPLGFMVAMAIANSGGPALAALLLDDRQRTLLSNTAVLGLSTAIVATMIGMPLGVALARVELPYKATLRMLLAAPMLLPPYIAALGWLSLAGGVGLIVQWVGRDVLSAWTYSMPGAVLVLALVFYPVSMLITEAAVRRIEPSLEEAALIIARPAVVLGRITLPLAAPGILAAALLVFVLAISEFGVPGLLRVRVFTTEVFTAFAALYDFGRATVIAVPLLTLSIVVAAAAAAIGGERVVITRRGLTHGVQFLEQWNRTATVTAVVVFVVALIVPLLLLTLEAYAVRGGIAVIAGSRVAIVNSLMLATVAAMLTTALGFLIGYAIARARRTVRTLANLILVVLFAVPGTIVGVGLIAQWNRPGRLGALYGTGVMLLLASLARLLPLASLTMSAAVRQVPLAHEEAAASAGAGWLRTVMHVIAPQLSIAFVATWVIVFVLSFGELGASILVAPPGETTLPIRIYTLIANAPPSQVAALALLQAVVTFVPLLLVALAVRVRQSR